MTKIMLVEDDNNLREIYEARLAAEGYGIVSAQDGEAALALAAKERPDLIITDVMMPKISGFEMLDILRNTEGLRDVKVIMLTALGQAEDNARAGALGADRYLVKSQVTLEDIVKAAHEVIEGVPADAATPAADPPSLPTPVAPAAAPTDSAAPLAVEPAVEQSIPVIPPEQLVQAEPEPVAEPPTEPVAAPGLPTEPPQADVDTAQSPVSDSNDQATDAPTPIEIIEPPHFDDTSTQDTPQLPVIPPADDSMPSADIAPQDDTAAAANPDDSNTPANNDADRPDVQAESVQAASSAAPASEEETDMRAQIDQFIDGTDTQPAAMPPEESEAEYAKDAQAEPMGELDVHAVADIDQEPVVPQNAWTTPTDTTGTVPPAPETPANAPGYPSQSYELPAVPGAAINSGDAVVSDAINTMMSQAPSAQQAPAQPLPPSAGVQQPILQVQDQNPAASGYSQQNGSTHNPIVSPLGVPARPDINQLLSMEESRAAAQAAGQQPIQGQQQPTQPLQQPQPGQPVDPNSISL